MERMLIKGAQLRDGRKADLEKHVEEVNALLRRRDSNAMETESEHEGDENEEWKGIAEQPIEDHESEFVDEDRFTTVTVEAVEVSRDGFQKSNGAAGEGSEGAEDTEESDSKVRSASGTKEPEIKPKKPERKGPKRKKKKFRYESKAERKATRFKETSRKRKQARDRKS